MSNRNWFCITALHDWLKNLTLLFHPIRSESYLLGIINLKISQSIYCCQNMGRHCREMQLPVSALFRLEQAWCLENFQRRNIFLTSSITEGVSLAFHIMRGFRCQGVSSDQKNMLLVPTRLRRKFN